MDYAPWCPYTVIYEKHGTEIIETDYREWVMKRMFDARRIRKEIKILRSILADAPRHSITVPPQISRYYDYSSDGGWYVMKRYTDEVCRHNTFCKEHWKTMAVHALQFLQDLHHNHHKVHMDIKKGNILYDEKACNFVVGDYELVQEICSTHILDLDDDHRWYYLAMGAELTEPTYSWRMDLVALGYVMASLTAPAWTFEQECFDHRTATGTMNVTDVLELRSTELAAADPLVTTYLDRVATIAWTSPDPPPRSFYEELEALFSMSDKPPEQET